MLGLTFDEHVLMLTLAYESSACRCDSGCVESENVFTDSETGIVDTLLSRGRLTPVGCTAIPGAAHYELTAEGREAMRIYEVIQLTEGVAA